MKKLTSVLLVLVLCLTLPVFAFAADDDKAVVTVSNEKGEIVVAEIPVVLSDEDHDGAITVNDVMILIHDAEFEGGAAAGFASETSSYGLSMTKLWGVENGGGYGYYINDAPAFSLSDPVKGGDRVYAFVYTDLTTWSDTYSFFDAVTLEGTEGDEKSLTLSVAFFDDQFNYTPMPLEGATLTFNGEKTEFVTDSEGKVTFTLPEGDEALVLISAVKDGTTIVPPICQASVQAKPVPAEPSDTPEPSAETAKPETGKPNSNIVWIIVASVVAVAAIGCAVFFFIRLKKK